MKIKNLEFKKFIELLEEHPNLYLDTAYVFWPNLPWTFNLGAEYLEKYQDRILFGKDSWVPEEYATYFRVLETEDEYFPYHKKYHAFWAMYGMGLPDPILKKYIIKMRCVSFPILINHSSLIK